MPPLFHAHLTMTNWYRRKRTPPSAEAQGRQGEPDERSQASDSRRGFHQNTPRQLKLQAPSCRIPGFIPIENAVVFVGNLATRHWVLTLNDNSGQRLPLRPGSWDSPKRR